MPDSDLAGWLAHTMDSVFFPRCGWLGRFSEWYSMAPFYAFSVIAIFVACLCFFFSMLDFTCFFFFVRPEFFFFHFRSLSILRIRVDSSPFLAPVAALTYAVLVCGLPFRLCRLARYVSSRNNLHSTSGSSCYVQPRSIIPLLYVQCIYRPPSSLSIINRILCTISALF